jgi:hypothetical protein
VSYHAKLSPSSAYRWMRCTASVGQSEGIADDGNEHARWGTAAHLVASESLETGCDAVEFLGREVLFCLDTDSGARCENFYEVLHEGIAAGLLAIQHTVKIDDEIVECAQAYVAFVRDLVKTSGGQLLIEQRVPIGHITGEDGAGGTSDTIIITEDTITVVDLKGGMGKVVAYAMVKPALPDPITGDMQPPVLEPNSQLAMYAGGALHEHGLMHDFKTVRMMIVQPRLNHVSEFTMPVADLEAFLQRVSDAAEATRTNPTYVPGEHCTFCKGRPTCQALTAHVLTTSLEGFSDVTDATQIMQARPREVPGQLLGAMYGKLAMIQKWCEDLGMRVFNELLNGNPVVNEQGLSYKLVAGKKGPRAWTDDEAAEAMLKNMRLRQDEMYDFKLISPTTAEKLAKVKPAKKGQEPVKPIIGERQWNKLQTLIGQSDPKASIALESDPRPALPPLTSGFEDTSSPTPATDTVDYFN